MKQIPLTQGKFALVDDEDFDRLALHKWYAVKDAALAYDTAALNLFGEFAETNQQLGLL